MCKIQALLIELFVSVFPAELPSHAPLEFKSYPKSQRSHL